MKDGKRTGSAVISWSFDENGKGIVILGIKNPLKFANNALDIKDVWNDEKGLDILQGIGIDPWKVDTLDEAIAKHIEK